MKSKITALHWHPTLSPHVLVGLPLRWAFPAPCLCLCFFFFPSPVFCSSHLSPPHPLAYFMCPRTEEAFLAPWPRGFTSLEDLWSAFPFSLIYYSIEERHLLGALDSFQEKRLCSSWNKCAQFTSWCYLGFWWIVCENHCLKDGSKSNSVWVGTKKVMGS